MSEKTVDFCDGTWKVGDRVFDRDAGWAKIEEISPSLVRVKCRWFYSDGRVLKTSVQPMIFPNEFEIPAEAYERPVECPDLAMDTPVWIKKGSYWVPKHFAGWTEHGRMKYWLDGCTSHTAVAAVTTDEWRLDDPAKEAM